MGGRRPGGSLLVRRRSLGKRGLHRSGDACGQCVANPRRLESVPQGRRVREGVEALRRNGRGAGRAQQQRLERGLGTGVGGERAGGRKIDLVERGRYHVLLIHVVMAQPQDADMPYRRRLHAGAHFESALQVADHLGRVVVDAPGREQRREIRRVIGHRRGKRIRRILPAGVRARIRIEEQAELCRRASRIDRWRTGSSATAPSDGPASTRRRPCRCGRRRR